MEQQRLFPSPIPGTSLRIPKHWRSPTRSTSSTPTPKSEKRQKGRNYQLGIQLIKSQQQENDNSLPQEGAKKRQRKSMLPSLEGTNNKQNNKQQAENKMKSQSQKLREVLDLRMREKSEKKRGVLGNTRDPRLSGRWSMLCACNQTCNPEFSWNLNWTKIVFRLWSLSLQRPWDCRSSCLLSWVPRWSDRWLWSSCCPCWWWG